ncbi:Neurexin-3b-beta [Anabarilius grahami]|uniref:Neurexin-3b-beta n=1 Tax=Anabarilius grahami TaxID=495550 RepID=A0A3N0Z5E0_ANAGA|nr:Neurexin-3b-beta [Anabarilius grahami]
MSFKLLNFKGNSDIERYQMANKKIPFKYTRPVEDWLHEKGRQLTIFNTQATISIGGNDRKRPYQGQLSGLYYNGLKVLNMAAEGHVNIKINGSVRLVGDVPTSRSPSRTTTSMPPEMSTTFIETTTTLSTTTTRKQRSPPTIQLGATAVTLYKRFQCEKPALGHILYRLEKALTEHLMDSKEQDASLGCGNREYSELDC